MLLHGQQVPFQLGEDDAQKPGLQAAQSARGAAPAGQVVGEVAPPPLVDPGVPAGLSLEAFDQKRQGHARTAEGLEHVGHGADDRLDIAGKRGQELGKRLPGEALEVRVGVAHAGDVHGVVVQLAVGLHRGEDLVRATGKHPLLHLLSRSTVQTGSTAQRHRASVAEAMHVDLEEMVGEPTSLGAVLLRRQFPPQPGFGEAIALAGLVPADQGLDDPVGLRGHDVSLGSAEF